MDSAEKAEFSEREAVTDIHPHGHRYGSRRGSRAEEIAKIDSIALAPETTLATFAHLDEKKILRKVPRLPISARSFVRPQPNQ
jgi:hypothetical protein